MKPPLRLSLTISGGASLGSYEAGAAAALVTGDVPLHARFELARVVLHAAPVVAGDALGRGERLRRPARRLLKRVGIGGAG